MVASFVVVLPFYTVSFRGSSLPGYCQKVTIILQAISLKLIQTRKHTIAIPNSECRGSSYYLSDILLPEQAGTVNWDRRIGYKSSFQFCFTRKN